MGMPLPAKDPMATITPDEARAEASRLAKKRSDLDEELEAYIGTLQSQNVTLTSPLVDAEGYPIPGVDLLVVRSARARVHALRNDIKHIDAQLTRLVEVALAKPSVVEPVTESMKKGDATPSAPASEPQQQQDHASAAAASAKLDLPTAPQQLRAAPPRSDFKVGTPVPPATPHAVSVSLPKWQDNVDYEEGRLTDVMETGYPRFFIHRSIQKLAASMTRKFGTPVAIQNPAPVDLSESTASIGGTQYESESCLLVSSTKVAEACRSFMVHHYSLQEGHRKWDHLPVRIVHFHILGADEQPAGGATTAQSSSSSSAAPSNVASSTHADFEPQKHQMCVHVVLFPASAFPLAKSFWQHTGDGISSRRAEACLRLLAAAHKDDIPNTSPTSIELGRTASGDGTGSGEASTPVEAGQHATAAPARAYGRNRHYARAGSSALGGSATSSASSSAILSRNNSAAALTQPGATPAGASGVTTVNAELSEDMPLGDQLSYVEERYGRNLPTGAARMAKEALKKRIAATLLCDQLTAGNATSGPCAEDRIQESTGPTVRQGTSLTEDDVFLFPTGMSAIWHAHQFAMAEKKRARGEKEVGKSVCFGFPYIDTLKILQKWGPGCHFFGHGDAGDVEKLRGLLESQAASSGSGEAPVLALFCEFPSNPLLRAPDMPALRALADQYDFLIIVDETIGNFLNVEVLPYADMVVSSLTKIFSGDSNVMGGSLVLNPKGPHIESLRRTLKEEYEDLYFAEDALFMERNSRAFVSRSNKINENALALVEMLVSEVGRGVVKDVYYPSLPASRENFDKCRRKEALLPRSTTSASGGEASTTQRQGTGGGGFGGLFSVTFTSLEASKAFYDALSCAKGPSLGSTFTLSCPYTLIAHYTELDWTESLGVDRGLVRISTGVEDVDDLLGMIAVALLAAGRAARRR